MSEQEKISLADRITAGIRKSQKALYERKAKLGESVVVADAEGRPVIIPAAEALRRIDDANP